MDCNRIREQIEACLFEELEGAELLTLGIVYEHQKRFAGSAYSPFLKRVDRFSESTLPKSLRQRQGWAARIIDID